MNNGHWIYPHEINVDDWFGFIYRIVNTETGQHYIGKKQMWAVTRKKIKGRKNRKIVTKESKWRTYSGSSVRLNTDIEELGMGKFVLIIESLHKTKGSLYYAEVEKQVKEDVMRVRFDNGIPKYYNGNIASVKFRPPEVLQEEIDSYHDIEPHKLLEMTQPQLAKWRETLQE